MKKTNRGSAINKKIFNILGAIVVLVSVAILAFWLNSLLSAQTSRTSTQVEDDKSSTETSAVQLSSTATVTTSKADLTVGWNVYEDKDLGFSIKFPSDWYFQENPDFRQPKLIPGALETKVMFANFPPPFLGPAGFVPEGCRFDVLVVSTENNSKQLLKADQYKQIGSLSSPATETVVVVNGIEGIRRTYPPDKKAVQQTRTVVLLPSSTDLFALYFWKEKDEMNNVCDDVLETMLQTFTILK